MEALNRKLVPIKIYSRGQKTIWIQIRFLKIYKYFLSDFYKFCSLLKNFYAILRFLLQSQDKCWFLSIEGVSYSEKQFKSTTTIIVKTMAKDTEKENSWVHIQYIGLWPNLKKKINNIHNPL